MRLLPSCLALALAASIPLVSTGGAAADTSGEDAGRLVLVLDSSGSMKESTGGGTRIEAAKDALTQVVDRLPEQAEVGIRVFGATVENRTQPGACRDTQNVVPVGPLDRGALKKAVAGYKPYGETPIGSALLGAAKDLGAASPGQRRTIVLLSDGEPNCTPDPCAVARRLTAQGIDLRINVVGLNVGDKARRALQCIAKAGKGTYVDAGDADELAAGLVKVSVRDLRAFQLTGARVEGGTTAEQPLPIKPGRYVDTALPDEAKRYYLIDKPKGGGVMVSALVRPPKSNENWHPVVRVTLTTPDGDDCGNSYDQSFQILGLTPVVSTGLLFNQFASAMGKDACLAAPQLIASVANESGPADYQLGVSTFPAITNASALPAASSDDGPWAKDAAIPVGGETTPVVGGVSPADAGEIQPGTTYTDTLRPSEQLVYKVPVTYGQALRFTVRMASDAQADSLLGIQGAAAELDTLAPTGQISPPVNIASRPGLHAHNGFYNGAEPTVLTNASPPLRVRNTESGSEWVKSYAVDGYQYYVLGLGRSSDSRGDGYEVPLRIRAEVVGSEAGAPEYDGSVTGAAASPEASPSAESATSPRASSTDSGSHALMWALGGVAIVVVAGAPFLLGRRGRTSA